MQHTAMHVKLGHFDTDEAYLKLPDELEDAEHIDVTIFHGDAAVLETRLKVMAFHPGKIRYIKLPTTDAIIWQKVEWVIVGITGSNNLEIVRSACNYQQVTIGPEDIE
ncbi:hypothetical protein [Gudongella sp.]|uniref:hypothetical protein n=1 Tax=uncultured Methanomethylovorans sp. TaxID=183759 RepID=UPI002626A345|nr:hypothetical protein [uncultured Methanomethylovorans sp.]